MAFCAEWDERSRPVSSVELSVKQREREEQERQEGLAAAAIVEDQEERDDY